MGKHPFFTTLNGMKTLYVYILECSDESYYVGVTNNVSRRFQEHQNARNSESYTASRLPIKLLYVEEFSGPLAAIAREKQLKGWTKAKKQALIAKHFDELVDLAKKQF
jgi:putative endonuclease